MSQVVDKTPKLEAPKKVVKPRVSTYVHRPVVAIAGDEAVSEAGEIWTLRELVDQIPNMPPSLFATVGAPDFVAYLNRIYLLKYPNEWQWRTAVHERDVIGPNGKRSSTRVSVIVHFFGFKSGAGHDRTFHKIIDPVTMYALKLDDIWPGDEPDVHKLLAWGTRVRDFCGENNLEVRPTTGGVAAQFLTDPRFYPNARRKVPSATNASVRERMPGNYYFLNVTPGRGREYTAHYLDQHRAHHYHARNTALPNADHLYAYGRFTDLDGVAFKDTRPGFYGLYCLDLTYERTATGKAFHWLGRGPWEKVFVYSNELPHLLDMGFRVLGVRAAWGSTHRDEGLARYACWCEEQLDRYADAKWLKPLLLSTYGTLATRPRQTESVFRLASGGDPVTMVTGVRSLTGRRSGGRHKLEPRIANVLHRGMIEAGTRSESVGLAQYISGLGHQVLSIYADAVIVTADDDRPLPNIPEPWRLKRTLHHLKFLNQQAFTSGEMTKLPGVAREGIAFNRPSTGRAPQRRFYTGQLTRQEAAMFGLKERT